MHNLSRGRPILRGHGTRRCHYGATAMCPDGWDLLGDSLVRATMVVMLEKSMEDLFEVPSVEDEEMVQAL
jgi:hypothetical protein